MQLDPTDKNATTAEPKPGYTGSDPNAKTPTLFGAGPTAVPKPDETPQPRQLLVAIDIDMWGATEAQQRVERAFGGHGVTFIDSVVAKKVEDNNAVLDKKAADEKAKAEANKAKPFTGTSDIERAHQGFPAKTQAQAEADRAASLNQNPAQRPDVNMGPAVVSASAGGTTPSSPLVGTSAIKP